MSNNEEKSGQATQSTTQHFSGGTVVFGTVNTGGGDFVGRDKVVYGVQGNELAALFAPLLTLARQAPVGQQAAAEEKVQALQAEVAKGKDADDKVMARLIEGLVDLVPDAVGAVVSLFATPVLGGIAKPATEYVLGKLQDLLG